MARKMKNFYQVLGVEKDATEKEIKKAYRRLSRELHPDVNSADDAQERFNEVKEAYEVLRDEELRKEYDNFADSQDPKAFQKGFQDVFDMFFSKPRSAFKPVNGADIEMTVRFGVAEVVKGVEKTINIKKHRVCTDCEGKGYLKNNRKQCKVCKGKRVEYKERNTPFGTIKVSETCEHCHGTGLEDTKDCGTCERTGWLPDDVRFTFHIPQNVVDNKVITFTGEGEPGRNGGKPGNLHIKFKHLEHDRFRIEHTYDVVNRISIGLKESLKGAIIPVIFPDERTEDIKIPRGVQNGQRFTFQDEGLYHENGDRGIFYAEFAVHIPSNLSDEQVDAILNQLDDSKGGE